MDLLAKLQKVRRSGEGWIAACSGHEDHTPSLSVSEGDDGKWLLTCFAGCSLDRIVGALGLEAKDLFPDRDHAPTPRVVKVYDYDTFEVVRYDPKSFRQRRPDTNGGYVWSVKGLAPRVYRQSDLAGQPTVVVCEGEKDSDRLWSLDIPATTNPMGAGKWRDAHTTRLVEAGIENVHLLGDNDTPGRRHVAAVAASCAAAGLHVKVPRVPDPYKDASEWLDSGARRDDLFELLAAAPAYDQTGTESAIAEAGEDETPDVDTAVLIRLSHVQPEKIHWMWPRRFARGKLTLITGDPGAGKSTALIDLGARVTQGTSWPDGGDAPQGTVLLLTAEDGLADGGNRKGLRHAHD